MLGAQTSAIDSYLGWWRDAGLADAVADQPCDWFAQATSPRAAERPLPRAADAGAQVQAPAAPLPDTLAAFDAWLASSPDVPGANWSARCLPSGEARCRVMLLSDVPDAEDIAAGSLFAGGAGRLLDAILAAIGESRASVRLGSLSVTRPVAGRIAPPDAAALAMIARHHIALVRPRNLILLGQQTQQLLGEIQPDVNQDGTTMVTIATHHPRLLLERPSIKRQAWDQLKSLRESG